MNIVIIGKSGQLAQALLACAPAGFNVVAYGRNDIDLTSPESITRSFEQSKPDVVINASAYTAVDKAETDQDAAYQLNATAVKYLLDACKTFNCRFLHVSTDFVFDGNQSVAYKTTDTPNPINVYGASKLAGEQFIQQANYSNAAIIRTSWVYSKYGNNFVKTMLRLMAEKSELSVVADQIGSPTNACGLADFLWHLATNNALSPIYHWRDLGVASWYDFAKAIQDIAVVQGLLDKAIPIHPITSAEYPTPAKRPHFSLLALPAHASEKVSVYWRDALDNMLRSLKNAD
ncbi:dTDP-4-dehydrorhamnose reductase [Rheinheimera sp. UJ51]|uniref:dTDP-4-dehydrorhamnose reductase n=1 Tax=Rheinheimera sp. UJ51 TaxID=2892446 RepID=UPI001E4B8580|nr:dTDP-4-dehydrorhamnose reductase [Rheinheimera sp. UJ51]MCC5450254.1 dTDP-4-dehydrorhamnose reductase [Rheinheimera sp. UJ51]